MITFRIKIAEQVVELTTFYETSKIFCKDYLTLEDPSIKIVMDEDLLKEVSNQLSDTDELEGRTRGIYTLQQAEPSAILKRISEEFFKINIMLFHGSTMGYKGKAYMFTAKSGTGKSTHCRLWIKNIKDSYFLNGDKPFLFIKNNIVYACGTPWCGKERYGINAILPLEAICILERDKYNHCEEITFGEAINTILKQSFHLTGSSNLIKAMQFLQNFNKVRTYKLGCNMDNDAALVSFNAMIGSNKNNNN